MIWAFAIKFGKRFVLVISLLLAIASLLLTACGSGENSNVYEVEHNGKVFTVNQPIGGVKEEASDREDGVKRMILTDMWHEMFCGMC